jgi:hypothetical protein
MATKNPKDMLISVVTTDYNLDTPILGQPTTATLITFVIHY